MTFKILYAASNRPGAKFQLHRFLDHIRPYDIQIKLAGYKRMNMNLDWCLDALQDIFDPANISIDNENLEIYAAQVAKYSPNLIISDLEPYTSFIGEQLDLAVWNVSPMFLGFSSIIDNTYDLGRNKYRKLFPNQQTTPPLFDLYKNIITNASRNYIYSFFCDTPLPIQSEYNWIRPYYYKGQISKPCECDYLVAQHVEDNKISKIDKEKIVFADPTNKWSDTKNIFDTTEYACNLINSKYCINQGQTDLLTDVLYNNKFPIVIPNMLDAETAINVFLLEHYKMAHIAYDGNIDGMELKENNIIPNENVRFLHQEIEALL